ncbi:phosphocarrier protein [Mobilisporobacter senegalensis]|uniref:Phosphocarrier protein HPr n=1 Tax=Mobilisporobacter senegalensis TaxID=1329262 RepID=A0A3N1XUZ3_9FIRM|nr:HPr family phosphocarrier protein [Mobilisporobacter senegalensis]ROR30439.1 phosphocarrier protein [Mobilisporobacter senegalensis]
MVSQKVKIINESGVHARPASILAKTAMKCDSDIVIKVGERNVNPKSVINLMAAAIKKDTEVVVECTGNSEKEDLKVIIDLINSGLGE